MDEEQICNECIYCVTYDYLRYSMSEGKKIKIHGNHKCEVGLDLFLGITKCSHFEEKSKDISKHLVEAKELANKGKKPRKQPKKKTEGKTINEGGSWASQMAKGGSNSTNTS